MPILGVHFGKESIRFRFSKISLVILLTAVALLLSSVPTMAPWWARPQLSGEKTTEHPWSKPIAGFIRTHNPEMSQQEIDEIIKAVMASSARNKLDPRLMIALIAVESNFNAHAVSSRGARGLTQITPDKIQPEDWNNIYRNVETGSAYLKEQMDAFPTVSMALAAYNAGPGRASKGPAYYPRETRLYIQRVLRLYESLLQTTEDNKETA